MTKKKKNIARRVRTEDAHIAHTYFIREGSRYITNGTTNHVPYQVVRRDRLTFDSYPCVRTMDDVSSLADKPWTAAVNGKNEIKCTQNSWYGARA